MPGPKTNERDGTRAFLRSAPMSAYKVREVLDLIRNQPVELAAEILRFCERGAAPTVAKVLASAVANAAANDDLKNPEELFVAACFADEGKTQRRMRPRARGRATRIRKRSAHITIIVARMPEDLLRRVRARQEAEQAHRRARRIGGRAGSAAASRPNRRAAAERSAAVKAAAADHDHDHEEPVEDGVVEDGVVEDGVVEDGVVEDGVVEDGVVEDGVVEDGEVEDGEVDDGVDEDDVIDTEAVETTANEPEEEGK
jgi:large subunit ribosomal protein L22